MSTKVCQKTNLGESIFLDEGVLHSFLGRLSEAKAGLTGTVEGLSLGMMQIDFSVKSGIAFDLK